MEIEVAPYNEEWPALYAIEEAKISNALGALNPTIEHIGSTSVPQLAAKPTIDIMIGLNAENDLDKTVSLMQSIGFVWNSCYDDALPFRRLFMRLKALENAPIPTQIAASDNLNIRKDFKVLCNVHTVPLDSTWWRRHIAFRDWLRTHAEDRIAYQNLKLELAGKDWDDTNAYAAAKTELIDSIVAKTNESSCTR